MSGKLAAILSRPLCVKSPNYLLAGVQNINAGVYQEYAKSFFVTAHSHILSFAWGDSVISVYLGQYHGCWCPGSLSCQDISSHDIDCIEYVGPSRTWGSVLSTCVKSMWRNDIKCKYMFMLPLKILARKGLMIPFGIIIIYLGHQWFSNKPLAIGAYSALWYQPFMC